MCFFFSLSAPSYRPTLVYDHDCFAVSKHPQSSHLFEKRTARLSPAVQVREETPRGGQRQRRSCRVSYFANQKAPRVDRAQFLLALHVSRGRRIVPGSCRSLPSRGSVRRNMPWYRVIESCAQGPETMTSVKVSTIRLM